jgi:pimeloyl-ACP methyl ester carboxylesterase
MRKILQRPIKILEWSGLSALCTLVAATIIALLHRLNTPQPLESILPGDSHIYRWQQGHIFYKTLGDENAPPLVLLHAPGIGASGYEMRKVIGALAQKYQVYAPDLLGFGLSDRPNKNYSADMYSEFCHDFLAEVVRRPTTILASGLSCNYAVIVAKRFPELCEQLILISPSALFGDEQSRLLPPAELIRLPGVSFFLYPLITTRLALRLAIRLRGKPSQEQIPGADVDYLYATTHQFGAEHAPLALLAGNLSVNASQEFDALQQPTFIIWGARALHNTWSSSQHHMPEQAEIALIQDAGLNVQEEYPIKVVENIREWTEGRKEKATKAEPGNTASRKTTIAIGENVASEKSNAPALVQQIDTVEEQAAIDTTEKQAAAETTEIEAYCARCKKKTAMQNVQEVRAKNGQPALRGTCSVCGAGQYRAGHL